MSNSACSHKLEAAVYLFDADTLRCEYANRAAQRDLQYSMAELRGLMPRDGEPAFATESLLPLLAPLQADEEQEIEGETCFKRKDGVIFPVAVRLHLWRSRGKSLLIIIAREITGAIRTTPKRGEEQEEGRVVPMSMGIGEVHPLAIVANSPGMVFQYVQGEDGGHFMPFISDQCIKVLGIEVERLKADPALLLDLVLPEDRESLRRSKAQSAASLAIWNWEGRLWIESYGDIKWVSLRASPRREKGVGVVWEGIIINVTQSRLREKELKESHKRLKEMSAHAMAAREHERIRIAQEIHDDLGGNLTAIKIDLDWLARHIGSGGDNLPLSAKIRTVSQMVDRTMHSIQRISRDLRPGIMDFGIVAAIEWEAKEFGKRLGVPCEVACSQQDIDLKPDMAVAVFRIFQEALTNITKHARASQVWVRLEMTSGLNQKQGSNQKQLELEVRDNGCGISLTDLRKHNSFGIRGMVERASFLNGKLTVSRGQEDAPGTTVRLVIPLVPVPEPDNMPLAVMELKAPQS